MEETSITVISNLTLIISKTVLKPLGNLKCDIKPKWCIIFYDFWSQNRTNLTICPLPLGSTDPPRTAGSQSFGGRAGVVGCGGPPGLPRGGVEPPCLSATACSSGVRRLILLKHQGWRLTNKSVTYPRRWSIVGVHPHLLPALGLRAPPRSAKTRKNKKQKQNKPTIKTPNRYRITP